jgi:LacI family transcriptional regulator
MRHVAALAGVGIKTVSRVVNGEPHVSEAMIERVLEAVERLDYQLDVNAGNLRRANGRTLTLGVLVGSLASPFAGAIHLGIEQAAWERDTVVLASSLGGEPDRKQEIVRAFVRRRVDGLILAAGGSDGYFAGEAARRTPLVFIGPLPAGVVADAVKPDTYNGSAQAARHLLGYGHRRIAYCGTGCQAELQATRERQRGFMEELGRAGIEAAEVRVLQDFDDAEKARNTVALLLRSGSRPTAIFASDSVATIGVARALHESGLTNSVALIGFDEFALPEPVLSGVTVVAQDPESIGRVAAERLFARIDGSREEPRTHTVPTTLVRRGSGELLAGN